MTPIQKTIRCYIGDKSAPSERDLLAFVGMLETGEACRYDFWAVGGWNLIARVEYRRGYMDAERNCDA